MTPSVKVAPDTGIIQKMIASDGFINFMKNYNLAFSVFLGIATLSILVFLFINITKLSTSADNDMRRRQAITGILTCLVCLAIAGGIDVIYAILLTVAFSFNG